MNKVVCITGASAGFGEAIARKFASNGWNCILVARRVDKLNALKKELESSFNVEILSIELDVSDWNAVQNKISKLDEKWKKINALVNNAGLALGAENFDNNSSEDINQMIDVNIKGMINMSKAIIPLMKQYEKDTKTQGHIINIGSVAGKNVYQNGAIYCMTKHTVIALSYGQRIDLLKDRIKVTVINPGAAETEFSNTRFKGDTQKAKSTYNGYVPLYANDVANTVFYCASTSDNVCIDELTVTCLSQANIHYFNKESQ